MLSATSTGENWPSSFPSAAGAGLCVPTPEQRGQVGTVMPQLVAHSAVPCLGAAVWVGVSNAWLSCRDSGCSATTSPFSLGHSEVKPALKRVSSLVETLVILYLYPNRVTVLLPTASLPS